MITPLSSLRAAIKRRNTYTPRPEAERGYVEGTRQTVKQPGDYIIDINKTVIVDDLT